MLRATTTRPGPFETVLDRVVLDFDERHRRRQVLVGEGGTSFLLDLADTPALSEGDGLVLEDGRVVTVAARPERLAEFRFGDPTRLARVAWHLGNRHTPAEVADGRIRIRDDYVLVELVKKLGVDGIAFVSAPFEPEGGAYGLGATMAHDHAPRPVARKADPGHGHHHHGHGHAHDHHPGHDHGHVHGPDCGCGHDHG